MSDNGVESCSDSIHRIHRTRCDSDGKIDVLFVRYLEKLHPCICRLNFLGVESSSNGIHRIHWRRIDSDGKVHDLFLGVLQKVHSFWMRGSKEVPMEFMGSIIHGNLHFLIVRDLV